MTKVEGERNPWDRLPSESSQWYDRFWTYVQLGPARRTIEECYRVRSALESGLVGQRAPGDWSRRARQWDWETRAIRYDEYYRQRLADADVDRRLWAREKRLTAIEEMLNLVMAGIRAAKLDVADSASEDVLGTERARRLLGVFRAFAHDLLVAHRLELGEPTSIERKTQVEFSADDFAEAQKALAEFLGTQPAYQPVKPERQVVSEQHVEQMEGAAGG